MFRCLLFSILCVTFFAATAQKKDFVVTIKTDYGNMVAILYDETPKHKANFIKLAKEHFYDSLLFHRVIEGFMIQGGDPTSKDAVQGQHLGNGGPGYTVDSEINPKFYHTKGTIAAARTGDNVNPTKASSGSQFYIIQGRPYKQEEITVDMNKFNQALMKCMQNPLNKALQDSINQVYKTGNQQAFKSKLMSLVPRVERETGIKVTKDLPPEVIKAYTAEGGAPHLDGGYTIFGKVIQGLEVIDKISMQPHDPSDRPLTDVRMTITIEELPRKKITKLYGYQYPQQKK